MKGRRDSLTYLWESCSNCQSWKRRITTLIQLTRDFGAVCKNTSPSHQRCRVCLFLQTSKSSSALRCIICWSSHLRHLLKTSWSKATSLLMTWNRQKMALVSSCTTYPPKFASLWIVLPSTKVCSYGSKSSRLALFNLIEPMPHHDGTIRSSRSSRLSSSSLC